MVWLSDGNPEQRPFARGLALGFRIDDVHRPDFSQGGALLAAERIGADEGGWPYPHGNVPQ